MKSVISLGALLFLFGLVWSQPTTVGSWRDYLPYNNLKRVVESDNFVYAASDYSLVEYDKRDNSISRLSKVHGLSDIGVSSLGYHSPTNTVIVGYSNGNVDFIQNGKVVNFPDIQRASLIADKQINDIETDGRFAYLACGFGIVQLEMNQRVVEETFFIGNMGSYLNVSALTLNEDTIFAATENGIVYAEKSAPLKDYNFWFSDNTFPFQNKAINHLLFWKGNLMANLSSELNNADTLLIKEAGAWQFFSEFQDQTNHSIQVYGDSLLFSNNGGYQLYNGSLDPVYQVFNYNTSAPAQPGEVILGRNGTFWVADRQFGFIRNPELFVYDIANLHSPFATDAHRISTSNGHVWVAAGSRAENYSSRFNSNGVYHKKPDETWETYNVFFNNDLEGFNDILTVAIDPFDGNHAFAAGLSKGLLEFRDGELVNVYDTLNSPLRIKPSDAIIGVDGMQFDAQGNLWVTNMGYSDALLRLNRQEEWQVYGFEDVLSSPVSGEIIIDDNGFKWFILPNRGRGVVVFNDAGTPENTADDEYRLLTGTSGNGGLPSTDVYSIAKDNSGEIWVGTNLGVAVFYNPGAVFLEGVNIDAQRIFVTVNGYTQYLLETETVTGIAVDGANRKWFATDGGGVFLMSEDGTQQIQHFTASNSPLFSNSINDIAFEAESGEVIIATDRGLLAFRSTATGGDPTYSEVYAYPNPVRRDYTGPIAVKGLAANSSIRITDINGNLVFKTIAEGGQAIWNGKNMQGDRVQTGVYLVFSADTEGTETNITKIMVVN